MTDEILIAGLKRKYAELAGQHRIALKTAHALKGDMATIKATLKLFSAEGALIGVKPTAPPIAGAWFKHGQCSRAVLDVLRTAPEPMTIREIAERVVDLCGLPKGERKAFVAAREGVRYVLRQHAGLIAEDGSTPKRWALAV
jgi:hypothetical protein